MLDVNQALAGAGRAAARTSATRRRALVVGAGGALGSAVLEKLLATHCFERVGALVSRPIGSALRGFVAVDDAALPAFSADTALVVFDRERHAFGREAAFVRTPPHVLPALASRLHAAGVRALIVVVPHAPALLPAALQRGLASLDEAAVAALGFEQLVFMRMPQAGVAADGLTAPRRLARWMLSQLRWMIPQREQPVRAQTVAQVVAALAVQVPQGQAGTRVVPSELLWQAAQQHDAAATVAQWLARKAHG
jgi:hypothetical protein